MTTAGRAGAVAVARPIENGSEGGGNYCVADFCSLAPVRQVRASTNNAPERTDTNIRILDYTHTMAGNALTINLMGVVRLMRTSLYSAALLLFCTLSACSTAPSRSTPPRLFYPAATSYWANPFWQAEMFTAVQSVVHLPAIAGTVPTPGIHGTVRFLYDHGAIKNPVIVESTGNPDLDKLLLQQVVTAKIPKPFGRDTDQPHEFALPLKMLTPYESFEYNVYAAIKLKITYGRNALIYGETGIVTVNFDYLDAKVQNIVIAKSSDHGELDKSSIATVSNAVMPPPPPGYAGKTVPMEAIFCYDINFARKCPAGKNIIEVDGTRIKRTEVF